MKFRGNYILMFVVQFFSGVWTYYACTQYGTIGVLYGFIPFGIALILVQTKYTPDEREIALLHKTESVQSMIIAGILGLVYVAFPTLNWFYVFVSSISVVRGVVGLVLFLRG